jgi:hypothetical protein
MPAFERSEEANGYGLKGFLTHDDAVPLLEV